MRPQHVSGGRVLRAHRGIGFRVQGLGFRV